MVHPPERLLSFSANGICPFVTKYSKGSCAGFSPASLFKHRQDAALTENFVWYQRDIGILWLFYHSGRRNKTAKAVRCAAVI